MQIYIYCILTSEYHIENSMEMEWDMVVNQTCRENIDVCVHPYVPSWSNKIPSNIQAGEVLRNCCHGINPTDLKYKKYICYFCLKGKNYIIFLAFLKAYQGILNIKHSFRF